jgi:outer membrane protein OmpA-like peptidoglycan-associated protein
LTRVAFGPRARSGVLAVSLSGFTLLAGASCASMSNQEQGAAAGAATGAIAGGIIAEGTGKSTARGAIIGAMVGGAAGAIIGHQMDQQAKEIQQQIPGAKVERVGEGIQVTFETGLLYDVDSDMVRPEAAVNLRNLAASLNKYPDTDALIVGHTDATGADDYNARLSERRATAAARFLTNEGVRTTRIRTSGRGETEPVASNDSADGRQRNRRIEVAIVASEAARKKR